MPYSMEEMQREMEYMGDGFLASFPTETVRQNMAVSLVTASSSEVDRLWTAYKKVVQSGVAPYAKASGGKNIAPLLSGMQKETGYSRVMIIAFLNGLEKAVREQGWDWRWLDPRAAQEAGKPLSPGESVSQALQATGQSAANLLAPVADPVTNIIKYSAIALVAGAVIYGIYQGSKIMKRRK